MARTEYLSSRWRLAARRVIDEVTASLPADVTLEQRRAAISAAYPFGERAMHPYKCWLAEVKRALAPYRPEPEKTLPAVTPNLGGYPLCGWCEDKVACDRCLMCGPAKDEWDRIVSDDPQACRILIATEPADRPIMADWLEEKGYPALARVWRETPPG